MIIKHLRLQNRAITLAIISDRNSISYGYSLCSDKDQFCRKTGRELAEYRLFHNPKTFAPRNSFNAVLLTMIDILTSQQFSAKINTFLLGVVSALSWNKI